MHLGYASPRLMLEEMTPEQLVEWRAYSMIEPFEDVRNDYRIATVVKALWDINRDVKKHPNPFNVEDFVLKYKMKFETEQRFANEQSVEERTRNLKLWAMAMASSSEGVLPPDEAQVSAQGAE